MPSVWESSWTLLFCNRLGAVQVPRFAKLHSRKFTSSAFKAIFSTLFARKSWILEYSIQLKYKFRYVVAYKRAQLVVVWQLMALNPSSWANNIVSNSKSKSFATDFSHVSRTYLLFNLLHLIWGTRMIDHVASTAWWMAQISVRGDNPVDLQILEFTRCDEIQEQSSSWCLTIETGIRTETNSTTISS